MAINRFRICVILVTIVFSVGSLAFAQDENPDSEVSGEQTDDKDNLDIQSATETVAVEQPAPDEPDKNGPSPGTATVAKEPPAEQPLPQKDTTKVPTTTVVPAATTESVAAGPAESPRVQVPGRGLRIAGSSVLAGGYGASAIVGIALLDLGLDEGGFYLIPLVGGFIMGGTLASESSDGKLGSFLLASFPSIVQTTGLLILIAGLRKEHKWKKEREGVTASSFVPVGPAGSAGLSVAGRF